MELQYEQARACGPAEYSYYDYYEDSTVPLSHTICSVAETIRQLMSRSTYYK